MSVQKLSTKESRISPKEAREIVLAGGGLPLWEAYTDDYLAALPVDVLLLGLQNQLADNERWNREERKPGDFVSLTAKDDRVSRILQLLGEAQEAYRGNDFSGLMTAVIKARIVLESSEKCFNPFTNGYRDYGVGFLIRRILKVLMGGCLDYADRLHRDSTSGGLPDSMRPPEVGRICKE